MTAKDGPPMAACAWAQSFFRYATSAAEPADAWRVVNCREREQFTKWPAYSHGH